jgi:dCMP deaminase
MGQQGKRKIFKNRITLDDYFLKIALVVGERSTCLRHNVGAVAVRDKYILSTGYNGAPRNTGHCIELGCLRDKLKITSGTQQQICRAVHAEQNVIVQASLHGVSLEGATIYCTHTPCIICAKMIVNAGAVKFVTFSDYNDLEFLRLFKEAGIKSIKLPKPSNLISELERKMIFEN